MTLFTGDEALGLKRSTWRRLTREGGWVLLGQLLAAVAGMVGVRLFTELAPSAVYGKIQLLLGMVVLGRSAFVAPFVNAQLRFHPEYDRRGLGHWFSRRIGRYARNSAASFAAGGAIVYTIWCLVVGAQLRLALMLLLAAFVMADTHFVLWSGRFSAERRQARYAIQNAGIAWLQVLLCSAGLWVAATPETYVAGQLAATVLVLLAMYKLLPALPPDTQLDTGEAAENLLPRVMQYGLPFAALLALSWINSVGDRYLLKWLMDDAAVGLYAAAYSLGSRPTLMVHGVLGGFLRPLLFQAASAGDQRKVRLIFRIWLLGVISSGIAVALAMMLFGEWVAQWLLAREYRATAPLIFLWVAAAYAVFGVVQVVENGILVRGGSRALVLPSLVSALAMVLFNFVLIPKHGAVGAAQATLLAFAMSLAVLSFSMWRAPAVVAAQAPPD